MTTRYYMHARSLVRGLYISYLKAMLSQSTAAGEFESSGRSTGIASNAVTFTCVASGWMSSFCSYSILVTP